MELHSVEKRTKKTNQQTNKQTNKKKKKKNVGEWGVGGWGEAGP